MSTAKDPKARPPSTFGRMVEITVLGLILGPIVVVWIVLVFIDPEFVVLSFYQMMNQIKEYQHQSTLRKTGLFYCQAHSDTSVVLFWQFTEIQEPYRVLIERAEETGTACADFIRIAELSPPKEIFSDVRSFGDNGLRPNTLYRYRICACIQGECSDWKQEAQCRTYQGPPMSPSGLSAKAISPNEIELQWEDNSDHELGFEIEGNEGSRPRCPNYRSDQAWREGSCFKERVGPNQTKWSKCGFSPGTTYTFRVSAFDQRYHSTNNPIVSVTTPPYPLPMTGRIGKTIPLPEMEGGNGETTIVWTGKEYALAWPTDRDDPLREQRGEYRIYQIYFLRLDQQFQTLGQSIRVSQGPGVSESPSLAWTGFEYGLVWMDSRRAVYDCDGSEGCIVRRDLFFVRLSAQGQSIGPEVWIQDVNSYWPDPKLFWQGDHYDLFWNNGYQIIYLKLNLDGEKMEGSNALISKRENEMVYIDNYSIAESEKNYGIVWVEKAVYANGSELFFARFNPEKLEFSHPLEISLCEQGKECSPIRDGPWSASVFWTGSGYGVCWQNHFDYTVLSMIPDYNFTAIQRVNVNSGTLPKICRDTGLQPHLQSNHVYHSLSSPRCLWNGQEIALIGECYQKKSIHSDDRDESNSADDEEESSPSELSIIRLSRNGKFLDDEKYLNGARGSLRSYPDMVWNGSAYVISGKSSLMVVEP